MGSGERVVFGTGVDEVDRDGSMNSILRMEGLSNGISFAKHTRPLYRMFAKAFRARGDREAALKVQDVLRVARARADLERVRREWYRREGRKRKKQFTRPHSVEIQISKKMTWITCSVIFDVPSDGLASPLYFLVWSKEPDSLSNRAAML